MTTVILQRRGGWFLPFRLASFLILLTFTLAWINDPATLEFPFILYAVATLLFALSLATYSRHRSMRLTAIFVAVQFVVEIAFECGIVLKTGGSYSPFSALLVLTIVSAALWYRLSGTLLVASAASLGLATSVWLRLAFNEMSRGLSFDALQQLFAANESAFYSVLLHFFIFYLVAFISGYLAERLNRQHLQLQTASNELRQARLETDEILRQVSSGLLTIDHDGIIVYFNRAAESILGYQESDIRGLPCADVFDQRMPALAQSLTAGLEYGMDIPRREIAVNDVAGKPIPIGISTSVMKDAEGTKKGLVAIFSDLTEAKALEAKMRSADRLAAVGELSASIAHEIRNPLASISGSVQILTRELKLSAENERLMNLIVKESDRLTEILTQFLIYARIDRPQRNKVELCHIINDTLQMLMLHNCYGRGMSVAFESEVPIVYVHGNEDSIKQMLINLMVNACEAMDPDSGRLTIRLDRELPAGYALLSVQDNGPGIPQEEIDRVFEPFFSTKKNGTGLGLSIVHRFAESMKLNLSVESTPGAGTTFKIEFRLHEQAAATETPVASVTEA